LLAVLLLGGCCDCPRICKEALSCLPEKKKAPKPILPAKLGPPTKKAPGSLDELLATEKLVNADLRQYKRAVAPYVGARVRWKLYSWGGEVTMGCGYVTPAGRQPPRLGDDANLGRIRMISPSLGPGADLGTVMEAGHPVVVCLALFPEDDDDHFIRDDGMHTSTPGMEPVEIEGTVWGATKGRDLWLHNCQVVKKVKEAVAP
jgi:hypothetical protein